MSYTIKFMDGTLAIITDQEFFKLEGKSGLVFVPSIRETINLSSVSRIYPSENEPIKQIDRSKQLEGVLHDGTRMTKQFGRWYCTDGQRDDKGNLATEADPYYYPELKTGILPTPTEYETKFNQIPAGKWSDELLMISQSDPELPVQNLENRGSTFLE